MDLASLISQFLAGFGPQGALLGVLVTAVALWLKNKYAPSKPAEPQPEAGSRRTLRDVIIELLDLIQARNKPAEPKPVSQVDPLEEELLKVLASVSKK